MAVQHATSFRQVLSSLGLIGAGGNYSVVKKHIEHLGLDTAHFKGHAWNRGLKIDAKPRRALAEILAKGSLLQEFQVEAEVI